MDGGILSEDAVVSHWRKLTHSALPAVRVRVRVRVLAVCPRRPVRPHASVFCSQKLMEPFQLRAQRVGAAAPPAELQSCVDVLQLSPWTVEGAT